MKMFRLSFSLVPLLLIVSPALAGFEPPKRTDGGGVSLGGAEGRPRGWAEVCYRVAADGAVSDLKVRRQSPVGGPLGAVGRDAVANWTFEPARLDGQPIPTSRCDVVVSGAVTGAVSEGFATAKEAIEVDLIAGDLKAAEAAVAKLEAEPKTTPTERALLDFLRHRLAKAQKNDDASRVALLRATIDGGALLPEKERAFALEELFVIEIKLRRYADALAVLNRLRANPVYAERLKRHGDAIEQLEGLATSDQTYAVPGSICTKCDGDPGMWIYLPLRRELGVQDVEGEIESVTFECQHKSARLDFQEDVSWTIPGSWGDCEVWLRGDAGTKFNLIEYGVVAKE